MTDKILDIVKTDFRRHMVPEGLERIRKCVDQLSHEEIWRKPNKSSNSVANLIIHLMGNVKQYIISGLGGEEDKRDRDAEFNSETGMSGEELMEQLSRVVHRAIMVVDGLTVQDLIAIKRIQGFQKSGISVIIHVIEHFSYHTGQITYYTKLTKDIDTGYYSGLDLNQTNG